MSKIKKSGRWYLHRGNSGWVFADWESWKSQLDSKRDRRWRTIIGKAARRFLKKELSREIERELNL